METVEKINMMENQVMETELENQTSPSGLERELQDVLENLPDQKSMERFRSAYKKLFISLKKSHENESRLRRKCRELDGKMIADATKPEKALKQSVEDHLTIKTLKQEIEKAWEMVDEGQKEEEELRKAIIDQQKEIKQLGEIVKGKRLTASEEIRNNLLKVKEKLIAEKEVLCEELESSKENYKIVKTKQLEAEKELTEAGHTIAELRRELRQFQQRCDKEVSKKKVLENQIKELQENIEVQRVEILQLTTQSQADADEHQILEKELQEQKFQKDKVTKELEQLQVVCTNLEQDREEKTLTIEQLSLKTSEQEKQLKLMMKENNEMKQEIANLSKTSQTAQTNLQLLEIQKREADKQIEKMREQIKGFKKEIKTARKQKESDRQKIDQLSLENRKLNKNMAKATVTAERQVVYLKLSEQEKKRLENDIVKYRKEAEKQQNIIVQLGRKRDEYAKETMNLKKKINTQQEELKDRDMEIFQHKKMIAEGEKRLKEQKDLYEVTKLERFNYRKDLEASRTEVKNLKTQINSMKKEINRLTECIKRKETELVKEHAEFERIQREKEAFKDDFQKTLQHIKEQDESIDKQKIEMNILEKSFANVNTKKEWLEKELGQVTNQRDSIGTRLVLKCEELSQLEEKIKVQDAILSKGEIQNQQMEDEIHKLHIKSHNMERKAESIHEAEYQVSELKHKLRIVQEKLMKEKECHERLKRDLEVPKNVHRWRRLEGTDPNTFELIQEGQLLRKQLLAKSKQIEEKERLLQKKEKLYVELQKKLARQPNPEVAQQLQLCQRKLKKTTEQLKATTVVLDRQMAQTQECKNEIKRLKSELLQVKKKGLMKKHKEEENRKTKKSPNMPRRSNRPRVT